MNLTELIGYGLCVASVVLPVIGIGVTLWILIREREKKEKAEAAAAETASVARYEAVRRKLVCPACHRTGSLLMEYQATPISSMHIVSDYRGPHDYSTFQQVQQESSMEFTHSLKLKMNDHCQGCGWRGNFYEEEIDGQYEAPAEQLKIARAAWVEHPRRY